MFNKIWFTIMNEKCPITPFEIIKRMPSVPKILVWSKSKHIIVSSPKLWGIHHIFIDSNLKHIIFLPKKDKTTHIFIGTPTEANEWRKYDKNNNLLFSKQLDSYALEWKIYKDYVLYKGQILPPKEMEEEPYWGKVIKVTDFDKIINEQWIVTKIEELYTVHNL